MITEGDGALQVLLLIVTKLRSHLFLVELPDQLLEDRAHRVVIDAGWREVDVGVEELVDQRPDGVSLGEGCVSWLRNLKLSRMSWTFGEKPFR